MSALDQLKYASLSKSERDSADAYAGPDHSFPLYKNGEHLRAAWDLAGHAANPDEVRTKIRAFAKEHGLEGHLPVDAAKKAVMFEAAITALLISKARSEDVAQLFSLAWNHEEAEGDKPQQARLAHFAKQHGLLHLLPAEAHSTMHDEGIVHEHEGVQNDEYGHHEHMVKKAFASEVLTAKAWQQGDLTLIEGWVSTPDKDLQKDIVVPEAFLSGMDGYALRRMPLSSEHNTRNYPVGHGQRVAVVRDGQILKAATHPDDSAEFEHFPNAGTGVYGRFLVTEPEASAFVRKGNVGGFSWIGKPTKSKKLADGGRLMEEIDPWLECTIASYPINSNAHIGHVN